MTAMEDVVITGVGTVTSVGETASETWEALKDGASGAKPISGFDPEEFDFRTKSGCQVDIDPDEHDLVEPRSMGRYAQISVMSAKEAIQDAGFDGEPDWDDPQNVGVSLASCEGGLDVVEGGAIDLREDRPIGARFAIRFLTNLAAGHVSIAFNAQGPNRAESTACAAGTHAICAAFDEIQLGRADVMIVGGSDAALCPSAIAAFDSMRALSTNDDTPGEAIRPFDKHRDGFLMGEGAGVLILETAEHAKERGADIYAAVEGTGRSGDADHPARPARDARGLKSSITSALEEAGRDPDEIDHVSAHGTATPRGDQHEAMCLNKIFDDVPPVTSIKSMLGHTLGASGAIEAVIGALSIQNDVIPPTINYETPDPDCDIPVVDEKTHTEVETVLSNSAGFGGTNGSVVIGSYE